VKTLLSATDENEARDDFRLACAAGSYTKASFLGMAPVANFLLAVESIRG
jgi:hypothetical protein